MKRFSGFACCFLELFCVSYDFVSLIGLDSIRLGFCLGDLDAVESCAKHISSLREVNFLFDNRLQEVLDSINLVFVSDLLEY